MTRTAVLLAAVLALSACAAEDPPVVTAAPPSPSAAGQCPERFLADGTQPWVPAPPTTETPGRLVPDADPVEALVCRYGDVSGADSAALDGEVLLDGGLRSLRTDLLVPERVDGVEQVCTQIGGALVPHLVRLRYADGQLWLSAVQEPNGCSASSNGAFTSSAYLGDQLAQAYESGTWPSPDRDHCAPGGPGRAGQEEALVPDGWTSLVVCPEAGQPRELAPDLAGQLADLLSQLETRPGTNACEGTPTSVAQLVATYSEGPSVSVRWTPGCEPSIGNGSLSAVPTPGQAELLTRLLG